MASRIKTSPDKDNNVFDGLRDGLKRFQKTVRDFNESIEKEQKKREKYQEEEREERRKEFKERYKHFQNEQAYLKQLRELDREKKEKQAEWKEVGSAVNNTGQAISEATSSTMGSTGGATLLGALTGINPAIMKAIPQLWNELGIGSMVKGAWNIGKGAVGIGKAAYNKVHQSILRKRAADLANGDVASEEDTNGAATTATGSAKKYGSAIRASRNDPITKRLDTIINLLKKPQVVQNGEAKKEDDGFFGALKGLGKLLLPVIAGGLLAMVKPWIDKFLKNFFSDTLGLGKVGGALGQIIGDMLPGAITGYLLTHSLKGALIGGAISLGYYTIKRAIDEFSQASGITADDLDLNNAIPYFDYALRGGIMGFAIGGWKGALTGAGIGMAARWLLNRVEEVKKVFNGEEVEIKTIAGIPEPVIGGMITGATLGMRGGMKGFVVGALIGGAIGALYTAYVDAKNRALATASGEYRDPAKVGPFTAAQFTGMLAGGMIGLKTGGIPGMIAGALLGLAAATIYDQWKGKKLSNEAAQKQISEHDRLSKIGDDNLIKQKATKGLSAFERWDTNHDGIIDEEERAALKGAWKGGESRELNRELDALGNGPITKEMMLNNYAERAERLDNGMNELTTKVMPTSDQMSRMDTNENMSKLTDKNEELIQQLSILNMNISDDKISTKNYINNTNGNSSMVDPYPTGSASQVSLM